MYQTWTLLTPSLDLHANSYHSNKNITDPLQIIQPELILALKLQASYFDLYNWSYADPYTYHMTCTDLYIYYKTFADPYNCYMTCSDPFFNDMTCADLYIYHMTCADP